MKCPEELRAEVRRLHIKIRATSDPALKRNLAARAVDLALRAEIIANLPDDSKAIQVTIAHYEHMLAGTQDQQRIVRELLRDIEDRVEDGLRLAS